MSDESHSALKFYVFIDIVPLALQAVPVKSISRLPLFGKKSALIEVIYKIYQSDVEHSTLESYDINDKQRIP